MPVNLASSLLPPTLSGIASIGPTGAPRFWATIWSDILKTSCEPSTKRKHLAALDRFYAAVERQHGRDCLDRLIAEADADALEGCLVGFLAQLRNEATIANVDKTSTWMSAISFVTDMLRYAGNTSGLRASEMEAKLLRLDTLYRQLVPNPGKPAPPVRALPPLVVEELYEIFNPESLRNPFKTEALRWRNLLIFMLLLRLGLRRGEAALLRTNSFKQDMEATGLHLPLEPQEKAVAYFVREPFPSVATGTTLRAGKLSDGGLTITSRMNEGGTIFADGMEQDRIAFDWGRRLTVAPSARTLNLVTG